MRYAAFISYNHRDRKIAGWLHRQLETYRIPKRLQGRQTELGILGARLPPVFQDREELAASSDLAASVREALEQASSLIVICSPNGAQSRWVNEEIRAFTALGRRDRIQCLIVAGEPNASRLPGGDPQQECLPPALFENGGGEPLASDIRPGQDGRGAAKLKLLAGILGVGYDELRQREQARRQKRLALIATVSGIGFVAMTALAIFALLARAEAVEQRDLARRKTITAERTVDFVKSMFAVADPSEARGRSITARELVDRGAARIDRELASEPAVRAELGTTLGEVYTNLGLFRQGEAMLKRMLTVPGLDPGTRARLHMALAETKVWQADDAGAIEQFRRALALARDPRSDRQDLAPRILSGMGESQGLLGETEAGERNIRAALAADSARGPGAALDVARDLEALGSLQFADGRYGQARAAFDRALRLRLSRQDELHPRVILDLNQLGSVAYMQGDRAGAERYFRRVLPLREKVLGADHPEVASALNNLARMLIEQRAYSEAEALLERAVAIETAQRGPATEELVFPLANLAIARRGTGDGDVRAPLEQARTIAHRTGHRNLAPILVDLADLSCRQGDRAGASALIAEARPLMRETYPDDPWRSAWVDLIDADCRRDIVARGQAARTILAKWPASTHYGARALRGP